MKLSTITITLILCLISITFANDYVIDGGFTGALTLQNSDTLLMTGGGIDSLTLEDDDTAATIQGTSPLEEFIGGVWYITVAGHLDISGGEIHGIGIHYDGTSTLSGGLIEQIHSYQLAWQWDYDVEPPVLVPDPHIEIICRDDYIWHASTNILTGTWADYSTFNIQLVNHAPYDPVIDNIKFTIVPEPLSLLIFAAGGTLLARRRH